MFVYPGDSFRICASVALADPSIAWMAGRRSSRRPRLPVSVISLWICCATSDTTRRASSWMVRKTCCRNRVLVVGRDGDRRQHRNADEPHEPGADGDDHAHIFTPLDAASTAARCRMRRTCYTRIHAGPAHQKGVAMSAPRYPALFQINTRVRLSELGAVLGRPATLDDVPDAELDRLAATGSTWSGSWASGRPARPRGGCRRRTRSG